MTDNGGRAGPVEHGFPHLPLVRASLTALYRGLSAPGVRAYGTSFAAADAAFGDGDDLHLGAQRVAAAMVRQLRLPGPDARMIVSFRPMEQAAVVELAAGPEYFIEVNDRFRRHRRDLAAALAHEVTHVLLHRLDLGFGAAGDDEILTDTAAAYLGAGWLLLDAYRQDALTHQKLGYLTPEEFGYVLAKRAAVMGEDPSPWFTSPRAYEAYRAGAAVARADWRRPPLAGAGPWQRRRYARLRRAAAAGGGDGGGGGSGSGSGLGGGLGSGGTGGDGAAYRFDAAGRVTFACPVCWQRLRVPAGGPVQVRCGVCDTVLACDT
ncbi:hypothetical protein [Streptomyces sp. NPDC090022]|uniref:hypothetical protein n=1 Tax=Streptomyces sp. NPDC090022 TaxID=3365920 RepID=UPI00380C7BC2